MDTKMKLPCGEVIKNRIIKSAMSENMASKDYTANQALINLYRVWAKGGAGICISGNIMIDQHALGEPANIVIDEEYITKDAREQLQSLAMAGGENETSFWIQLNHPGKQSPKFLSKVPVAPSALAFPAPLNNMFNTPKELTHEEIEVLIGKFAFAAKLSKEVGFSGVQIHGAHGYLISQFLSPIHNQRIDIWGGSIENRMRFVLEVYKAIRKEVGSEFPIGIKLNSADFMKGGFSEEDSTIVVKKLDELGIDLIEISGGTYEVAAMTGKGVKKAKQSTLKREAYFLDFTQKIRKHVNCPLLLTGGFRSLNGIKEALKDGSFDFVGLARAIAVDPDLPNKLLAGKDFEFEVIRRTTGNKILDNLFPLEIIWYTYQLMRIGKMKKTLPYLNNFRAILWTIKHTGLTNLRRVRA